MKKNLRNALIAVGVVILVALAIVLGLLFGGKSSSTPTHVAPTSPPVPHPTTTHAPPPPHPTARPVPPDNWVGYSNYKKTDQSLEQKGLTSAATFSGYWSETNGMGMTSASTLSTIRIMPITLAANGKDLVAGDSFHVDSVSGTNPVRYPTATMIVSPTGQPYVACYVYPDTSNKVNSHVWTQDAQGAWVHVAPTYTYTGADSEYPYTGAISLVNNTLNVLALTMDQASGSKHVYGAHFDTTKETSTQYTLSLRVPSTLSYGIAANEEFCVAYYYETTGDGFNRIEYFPAATGKDAKNYDNTKPGTFLRIQEDALEVPPLTYLANMISISKSFLVWTDAANLYIAPRDDTFYDETKKQTIPWTALDILAVTTVQITNDDTIAIVTGIKVVLLSLNDPSAASSDLFNVDEKQEFSYTADMVPALPTSFAKARGVGNMLLPRSELEQPTYWDVFEWFLQSKM